MNYQNRNQQVFDNNNNDNQINNKKIFSNSLHIIIKIDDKKEEIIDLKPGEDPLSLLNNIKNNNSNLNEQIINLIYQKITNAINFNKNLLDLVPSNYTLKKMNVIKNTFIEKEKNSEIQKQCEPFLQRNYSFFENKNQYEHYISDIKPSDDDLKEIEPLNISL